MDQQQDNPVDAAWQGLPAQPVAVAHPDAEGENKLPVVAFKIALYLLLFGASFLIQKSLSSSSSLAGVVAQFQVMISVFLVMSIPGIGFAVALGVNFLELVFLASRYLLVGDELVLPGLFVYLCAMITLFIISLFGRRLNRKNQELAKLYEQVSAVGQRSAFQANHDELTELANTRNLRTRLAEHFAAAAPDMPSGGLALIKLENFKVINSVFGPKVGDAVLRSVARRLREFAEQHGHYAARVESSTFALLFQGLRVTEEPLHEVLARLHEQLQLEDGNLEVRACAGYAECGGDAGSAEALYQCAEFALALARESGSQSVRIYDSQMARAARRSLALVNGLELALSRDEFTLLYQPQIDVRTGRVTGAEALIRWENASLGKIMPSEFIPLAEQNGQILAMGSWILERACRDASLWPDGWKVSVNISSGQFFDRNFESHLERALSVSGLAPERLKLEITESVLIGDETSVVDLLQSIRARRVTIAMDDFGTGYSSLSYLKNIPIDELKIDRSFVIAMAEDPNAEAIVETIIHLARLLKLTTTAEGVETHSQAEALRSLGCDCFQGYLYGKPMPVEDFVAMQDFQAA